MCRTSLRVVAPVTRRRRAERRRGLDPALVQSFPMYTHDASKLARGESQTPKTDIPRSVASLDRLLPLFQGGPGIGASCK